MKATLILLCAFTGLRLHAAQATTNQAEIERPVAEQRSAYHSLNRQLFSTHEDPQGGSAYRFREQESAVRGQIESLITAQIAGVLNAPNPSPRSIAESIRNIQGDDSLDTGGSSNTPWAQFFDLTGIRQMAVAYNIIEGGDMAPDTHAYLDFYHENGGKWQRVARAETVEDFRQASYFVSQMDSGLLGESWFLAWGKRFGDTAARLRARLYAYDGASVRTVWRRDELIGGEIKVFKDSITLEYNKVYKSIDPGDHVSETFRITPGGLQ